MNVLVTDYAWASLDIEREELAPVGLHLVTLESDDDEELVEKARDSVAIMTNWRVIPERAVEGAARCVVIARYGVGVDNIPVEAATASGIVVANVPDYCVDEVAEHTLALVLACARRIVMFNRRVAEGTWTLSGAPDIRRVRGQTLGLVGYGRLARAVAERARAFGLRVIAFTPRLENGIDSNGVETTNDLRAMLAIADFVSIHVPGSPATRHLIGEAELAAMRPTAFLINTARGSLIDEAALLRALDDGAIAGAALDVLASEPPGPESALLDRDDVIVTPHAAFFSIDSVSDVQRRTARNVAAALRGERVPTAVNPAVYDASNLRRSTFAEL